MRDYPDCLRGLNYQIQDTAEKEYREECFRSAVELYKQKLRERKSVWDRIIPFKVIIVRKDKPVCWK